MTPRQQKPLKCGNQSMGGKNDADVYTPNSDVDASILQLSKLFLRYLANSSAVYVLSFTHCVMLNLLLNNCS